jgi:hypothetical protein
MFFVRQVATVGQIGIGKERERGELGHTRLDRLFRMRDGPSLWRSKIEASPIGL